MIDADFEFKGFVLTAIFDDMLRTLLSTTTTTTTAYLKQLRTSQAHFLSLRGTKCIPPSHHTFQASLYSQVHRHKTSVDHEEVEDFGEYDVLLPPDEPVVGRGPYRTTSPCPQEL